MPVMKMQYQSLRRLHILISKLNADPDGLGREYKAKMSELFTAGFAEEVPANDPSLWVIPHFPAFHPFKPGPRVVFDCAASADGVSLNSTALSGPNLVNLLMKVFLTFRKGSFRLCADIKSMFYMVRVPPSQRRYLRFYWFPEGDTTKQPRLYQLTVHLFGGTWSPGVAAFCLQKAATEQSHLFPSEIPDIIANKMYVDDLLHSGQDGQIVTRQALQVKECIGNRGFILTKFFANEKSMINSVPEDHRAAEVRSLSLEDDIPLERALGQFYDPNTDNIVWRRKLKPRPNTKRGVLSAIASCFDPCGYLAPLILEGKLIFQEECRVGHGWDDPLLPDNLRRWLKWLQELPLVDAFQMPCGYIPRDFGEVTDLQLHNFCDGSSVAWGSAHYLRAENAEGNVAVSLVMAKTRIKPLNTRENLTVPKTELNAAVQAVDIAYALQSYLSMPIKTRYFWTDSTIVLSHVNAPPSRRLKLYVHNRMRAIWSKSDRSEWRYCPTSVNPADHASRGMSAKAFVKAKDWISGPAFLKESPALWPDMPPNLPLPEDHMWVDPPEAKKASTQSTLTPVQKLIEFFTRGEMGHLAVEGNTWNRIRRAVAWLIRIQDRYRRHKRQGIFKLPFQTPEEVMRAKDLAARPYSLRPRRQRNPPIQPARPPGVTAKKHPLLQELTAGEVYEAQMYIIRDVQWTYFTPYVVRADGKIGLPKTHQLNKWSPYLDDFGVLRSKSRVETSRPIIIPRDSVLFSVLAVYYHTHYGHRGQAYTLSVLKSKGGFLVSKPLRTIASLIKVCLICQKLTAKNDTQQMGNIHPLRLTPGLPPFTYVGLDCFGFFRITPGRVSRATDKRWGLIITCAVTRAVHLEMLYSMDTASFIMALRRFQARRRWPVHIFSDNGTNFTGAEKELRDSLKYFEKDPKLQKILAEVGVTWTFITPTASNQGGFYERMISTVRRTLDSVMLQVGRMNDEKFNTLLIECENIVNERPLLPNPTNPLDLSPLTPNDLLKLGHSAREPISHFGPNNYYNSRWRHMLYCAELFYQRYRVSSKTSQHLLGAL